MKYGAACGLILALLAAFAGCGGPDIPEYEGKTLEEWVTLASGPAVGPANTTKRQREEAFAMLGEIGGPAVEPLREMVTHADSWISGGAVKAEVARENRTTG